MRFLFLSLVALWPTIATAQVSFGSAASLNDGWAFALQDDPTAKDASFDDRTWQRLDLPHDWSVQATPRQDLASCTGYLPGGVGWYRKKLTIPKTGGDKVFLYFEGIYARSDVYMNGRLLGHRPNGYVPLVYDVTDAVRLGEENTIAVRVDHSRSADSRWYTGSGIYRNVCLVRAERLHLAPFGIFVRTERADDKSARIRIETEIQNEASSRAEVVLLHELLASDGKIVASVRRTATVEAAGRASDDAAIEIERPRLWSVTQPNLYRLRTTVSSDGRELERASTSVGIRVFAFDPDHGFTLNGQAMKMKGVCLHDDAGVLGNAVPRIVWRKHLEALKSIGCNAIRMSHNPHAPELYTLCDELGLLVLDEAFDEWEFPKRKWLRGWNVGEPGFEGPAEFFQAWAERDIAAMVRGNRNHPSIFAWSIGNEVDYPNDPYSHPVLERARIDQPMLPGYKPDAPDAHRLGDIAKRLAAAVRKQDSSRPVTAALAGVVMSNETDYPGALDLAGYNYTEDRYATDHARYPRRVIYGSENRHTAAAWRAVTDNEFIFGQFLWTGIDYLGEAGPWPSRGSTSGLLDMSGAIKPRGHFRAALWSQHPVIYLGTEAARRPNRPSLDASPLWQYEKAERVRVLCYTNAAKIRLVLNGKSLGEDKPADRESGVTMWELPYEAGQLEAIGYNAGGEEICRTSIASAGEPSRLELAVDGAELDRNKGVAIVALQIVDAKGRPVLTAASDITCHIEGPARLLGLENGDTRDMSVATDATRRAFHGRLVAYIQADGRPGVVHATFSTATLPAAIAEMHVP